MQSSMNLVSIIIFWQKDILIIQRITSVHKKAENDFFFFFFDLGFILACQDYFTHFEPSQ